jgi:hypothetical protein
MMLPVVTEVRLRGQAEVEFSRDTRLHLAVKRDTTSLFGDAFLILYHSFENQMHLIPFALPERMPIMNH